MDIEEHETPWIKRVEELIQVLEGSTIGELELTEAGTEIIIRRRPDMMMVSVPSQQLSLTHTGIQIAPGSGGQQATRRPQTAHSRRRQQVSIIALLANLSSICSSWRYRACWPGGRIDRGHEGLQRNPVRSGWSRC